MAIGLPTSRILHTLGGMACVSGIKAPSQLRSKWKSKRLAGNGLNARFDETAHVIAAEPRETLVRIGVVDDDGYTQREVAFTKRPALVPYAQATGACTCAAP